MNTAVIESVRSVDGSDDVVLAIDTSIGSSVALSANGHIFSVRSDDAMGHAEMIGPLLERVFALAGVDPSEVTVVVQGSGPGPFTGLRVGMAAASAFAAGRQLPVSSVHGHQAVALQEFAAGDTGSTRVRVVQDARRRELFVSTYGAPDEQGLPTVVEPAHLVSREEFVDSDSDVWPECIPADCLVELALLRLSSGIPFETDEAVYLRAPDVRQPGAAKRVVP